MAKEERSSAITLKLVLAFVCMALLAFSLPSSLISMNASGQNSTSSDTSDNSTNSSPDNSSDASSSNESSESTDSDDSQSNDASQASSPENDEAANSNATSSDTNSAEDQNSNSTSTENMENQQSQNATSSGSDNTNSTANSNEQSTQNATSSEIYEPTSPLNSTETAANQTQTEEPLTNVTSIEALWNETQSLVTISGEPFVLADNKITRSFSYPLLEFQGETAAELIVTLTWDADGTTKVEDNRGYSYTIDIPESQGNFSLWYNSTHVDQRIVGPELQYDVYWIAVEGENGYIDRYKYTIAGTSVNGSIISFEIDGGKYDAMEDLRFFVEQPASVDNVDLSILDPALDWTAPANDIQEGLDEGESIVEERLELDWSDAITSGYNIHIDHARSAIDIPVGKSFFIDPTVVTTTTRKLSPDLDDTFEGQVRMITTANDTITRINAFYYDGSNIVYRTSDDEGKTWSSAVSTGSGTLASDIYRWTVIDTVYLDDAYVSLLYWTPAGTNMNFYVLRGTVSNVSISWSNPILLGYTWANSDACGSGGACASVTASTDYNGTIYAAFQWRSGGSSTYSYQIMKSADGGLNWSTSLSQVDGFSTSRISMALTVLNSSKVLFAYAKSSSDDLFYRVYDGSSWGSQQTITDTGLATGDPKQLSATSNGTLSAFVAYTNVTTGGGSGIIKVARFSNTGTFEAIETPPNGGLRHSLPNIMYNGNGDLNINSIADGKVYNTRQVNGIWEAPFNPYGTSFNSTDQLTATNVNNQNAALWMQGTASPWNITFAILKHGSIGQNSIQNSPGYADYFEGERRVVNTIDGTFFVFYNDGNNIVYKVSHDGGHTWSGTAISTGTGQLDSSDNYRWTVVYGGYNDTERISLLYYKLSGSDTDFFAKTFTVDGTTLSLVATVNLFSAANDASCTPTGVCTAASGASDINGTLYAAFSYKTGGTWYLRVMNSSDGGETWDNSLGPSSVTTTGSRVPITITALDDGKMLLALAKYDSASLFYRVYDGSSWGATITKSGIGWSSNTIKQISSQTVDRVFFGGAVYAYVVFLSNGNQGELKVAEFAANGSFRSIETADSTINHWLPSIVATSDGSLHVFTLYNNSIYETMRYENPVVNEGFEYVNHGIDQEPSGYWIFANDTADDSGNGNNGTLFGNAGYTYLLNSTLAGGSLDLNGSGDYMKVPDSPSLDITANITISAWVRLDEQTNDFRSIVNKQGAYSLEKNSLNIPSLTVWTSGGSSQSVNATTVLGVNKWYHLAGTYNGSSLKIYVNGVLEADETGSGSISTSNNDLFVGSADSTSRYLNGAIDDVTIYDKALNKTEIASIGTGWDLRDASLNTENAIHGHIDLVRPGSGDTRSFPIPASPDQIYKLQAEVIVTSGFAKIELVFLDASGNWLTNNTLPLSGIAATSTTGSIQILSATWQAPEDTESMIIRLINNVSAGSARFDLVRVTNWESPIQPYGYGPYYPDEMTGLTGYQDSAGVMAKQDNDLSDTLTYSGNFRIAVPGPGIGAKGYLAGCKIPCSSTAKVTYNTFTKKSGTFFSSKGVLNVGGPKWWGAIMVGNYKWTSKTSVDLGKNRVGVFTTGPYCVLEIHLTSFGGYPLPDPMIKCLKYVKVTVKGSDGYYRSNTIKFSNVSGFMCCFYAKGGVKVQTTVLWSYR